MTSKKPKNLDSKTSFSVFLSALREDDNCAGYSLIGVLTGVAVAGVLMAALISFSNQSAKTLQFQSRMASFNSKSITLFQNINKLCSLGNFMTSNVNSTATSGFPIKLRSLNLIRLAGRNALSVGKGREYDIDRISFNQDGPVMGTSPKLVSTHLFVEGTIKKANYKMVGGKRKYDRKPITRRFPILISLDATNKMIGCVIPTVSKEQMCTNRGGVWQGDYASPRCKL